MPGYCQEGLSEEKSLPIAPLLVRDLSTPFSSAQLPHFLPTDLAGLPSHVPHKLAGARAARAPRAAALCRKAAPAPQTPLSPPSPPPHNSPLNSLLKPKSGACNKDTGVRSPREPKSKPGTGKEARGEPAAQGRLVLIAAQRAPFCTSYRRPPGCDWKYKVLLAPSPRVGTWPP